MVRARSFVGDTFGCMIHWLRCLADGPSGIEAHGPLTVAAPLGGTATPATPRPGTWVFRPDPGAAVAADGAADNNRGPRVPFCRFAGLQSPLVGGVPGGTLPELQPPPFGGFGTGVPYA